MRTLVLSVFFSGLGFLALAALMPSDCMKGPTIDAVSRRGDTLRAHAWLGSSRIRTLELYAGPAIDVHAFAQAITAEQRRALADSLQLRQVDSASARGHGFTLQLPADRMGVESWTAVPVWESGVSIYALDATAVVEKGVPIRNSEFATSEVAGIGLALMLAGYLLNWLDERGKRNLRRSNTGTIARGGVPGQLG